MPANSAAAARPPDARPPVVFLLSGQGSHYRGMGRALFEEDPVFRRWMFWADHLGQREAGFSVVDELYADPPRAAPFDRLTRTHPALYAVELALCHAVRSWGVHPDRILGASLGEYTAMAFAGAVGPDLMFRLLQAQAAGFEAHAPRGGMTAVLADALLPQEEPALFAGLEVAAVNFDRHFVVSGPTDRLAALEDALSRRDILFQRLEVSFGFHASFIDPAKAAFDRLAGGVTIGEARVPLISCVDGRERRAVPRNHLWNIVRQPILFADTVRKLEREGPQFYVDVGPSGTLANFVRYLLGPEADGRVVSLMTPGQASAAALRERLAKALAAHRREEGNNRSRTENFHSPWTTQGA